MKLRLGTRGSTLARVQSELIAAALRARGHDITLVEIKTTGDALAQSPQAIEGTGIFTRELDAALRDGQIDLAVHSLKDLPSEIAGDLILAAIAPREDPRDVLISATNARLSELPAGAVIGTGSPRRAGQILALRNDVTCRPARGNVDTRIRKLREGQWDAIVLALAGLKRLELVNEASGIFDVTEMIPAPGQGALAVVTGRAAVAEILAPLDDERTRQAVTAERRLLQKLEGGCRAPIAAHAFYEEGTLKLIAAVFSPEGTPMLREERSGSAASPLELADKVAAALLTRGAAKIVAAARA